MLVNNANTWRLRPEAGTAIANFMLASDYVRTHTDLATMEGANEAARRAVNAILERSGSQAARCKIWNLHEPDALAPFRAYDKARYAAGLPWDDRYRARRRGDALDGAGGHGSDAGGRRAVGGSGAACGRAFGAGRATFGSGGGAGAVDDRTARGAVPQPRRKPARAGGAGARDRAGNRGGRGVAGGPAAAVPGAPVGGGFGSSRKAEGGSRGLPFAAAEYGGAARAVLMERLPQGERLRIFMIPCGISSPARARACGLRC